MLFLNTGKIHSLGQIPRKMHKFYRRRVGPRPLSPLKKTADVSVPISIPGWFLQPVFVADCKLEVIRHCGCGEHLQIWTWPKRVLINDPMRRWPYVASGILIEIVDLCFHCSGAKELEDGSWMLLRFHASVAGTLWQLYTLADALRPVYHPGETWMKNLHRQNRIKQGAVGFWKMKKRKDAQMMNDWCVFVLLSFSPTRIHGWWRIISLWNMRC